ncbi:MAG: hypothetical protein QNK31_11100 [Porticoccus sp.]|nr:hypothetical protein [Porticoccus sp.]
MKPKNKVLSLILSSILGGTLALLLASCQSSQSSNSTSSSSSMPTAQPTPPSTTASSSPSSSASGENTSSEENEKNQSASGDAEPYGEEEPGIPSGGDVLSEEEAVAVLDEQFDESMAVFDGMIVNERAAAQSIESEFPDEGGLGNDSPLYEEADISEDSDSTGGLAGDVEEPGRNGSVFSDTQGDRGASTASNGGNIPSSQSSARAPTDIPDGRDDDIVARQIREAALKEQDPVLREKLWEEYRKYKKGQ